MLANLLGGLFALGLTVNSFELSHFGVASCCQKSGPKH
jgi:hypothetical protein